MEIVVHSLLCVMQDLYHQPDSTLNSSEPPSLLPVHEASMFRKEALIV